MTTNQLVATRPESNEYAPYYGKYVSLVPEGDILVTLENQLPATLALLARPESDGDFRYAPGKWSVKESLGTRYRRRARFQLPGTAHLPQRQNSSRRLRAG